MTFGPRGAPDPLLAGYAWRQVRAHWKRPENRTSCQAPRCYLPGVPIDYDGPYWVTVHGRRTINPYAYHCGHIVSRRQARRLGWTDEQTNAVTNTRPEHARCSVKAGAREGRHAQGQRPPRLDTSRNW